MQRRDDETVVVVHPDLPWYARYVQKDADYERLLPQLELLLPAFTQAATAAHQARVTANSGRVRPGPTFPMLVSNASQLATYYREVGAYRDPASPPVQPPPVLTCASGTAVANPNTNRGLVHDCTNLLAAKDELRGTGTLNWSTDLAIGSWEGITTGGTPSRMTKVVLPTKSLNGTIPASLGTLFELTHLDLSSNALTGSIPTELGLLHNLQEVRLSGNSLTGCIPVALQSIATNDLSSLNLLYCAPPSPGSLSAGTVTRTTIPLTWGAVSNASKYRVEYRLRGASDWTVDTETVATASHTVDQLACGTAYQFRVSAYGSGTVYAAAWSERSAVLVASTAECVSPVFDEDSYSFDVPENARNGASVGTVSATDPNGDALTYSITAGNASGTFAIGSSTGAVTVAGTLNRTTTPTHTLTVQASDGGGNTDTVSVAITVTEQTACTDGVTVPNPASNADLVSDCRTLLALRDDLRGTGTLNWSDSAAMTTWTGVTISGTPQRVTRVSLNNRSLTGVVPAGLGDLGGLDQLLLEQNQLTGGIPEELASLSSLTYLSLEDNRLDGEIPTELSSLTGLQHLWLNGNRLTGSIPPEIGELSLLLSLRLANNQLTGAAPGELAGLRVLAHLLMSGNSLTVACLLDCEPWHSTTSHRSVWRIAGTR